MATNGNYTNLDQFKDAVEPTSSGPTATNDAASAGNNNLSKDEVGWYFVEQYYTTLSKNPDKLHLFYGKRSQFVYGMEAEVANVSVGRQAIQERIKSLDFENSKVRITNVDSQASFDNIVIQVIGESSIKSAEPKKFVQTFVLAPQPSGYFVVNDILRYINDEDEDEPVAEPEAAPEEQAAPEEVAKAPAQQEVEQPAVEETPEEATGPAIDAAEVEKKLEEVSAAPEDAASNNGEAETAVPEPATAPEAKAEEPAADPDATANAIAEEDIKEPEKPTDPSPTPVAPTKAPAAEPEKPAPAPAPVPMKPMSWASRAAAAVGPKPVVPLPKTATPPAAAAAAAAKAPAPAAASPQPAAPAATAAAAAAKEPEAQAAKDASSSAEWQSVGTDSKRQNRPQSISQAPTENYGTLGYVKYVTDKVKAEDLKAALAAHGELTYFDINRQKNCAFVEFATVAGYQAAAAANPHTVNGENIIVEPRRPKATAYGGSNYSTPRGNATGGGRGRGGFEGNRSGSQGNARGNFTGGQTRGRGSVRGRGASQAAA
ncbi:putative G3BP-like protein [Colletotrichum liriopes]|uniref:G3BP-like protein n=1 Tax=Colletotrichum liriopes TaxID=708192 RepID=A0AA37LQT3_9PEZI|nr:putative G3BP-like protein [Colletotrichum liriopes]